MTTHAFLPEPGLSITIEDFLKFKDFFYRRTGISFESSKRYFVDKRLVERIEATGTANFRGYFTMLRFQASGEELQQLTNLMTVNETYFLREEYQFRCLVDSILPEIVRHRTSSEAIRIWCIPSSSGEEPYSIAMYLLEHWSGLSQWDVEIISSDIDTSILRRARAGRYSARSVKHILLVQTGGEVFGLMVDSFKETIGLIQKPLGGFLSGLSAYSGSALMGDGSVLMILNIREIV